MGGNQSARHTTRLEARLPHFHAFVFLKIGEGGILGARCCHHGTMELDEGAAGWESFGGALVIPTGQVLGLVCPCSLQLLLSLLGMVATLDHF